MTQDHPDTRPPSLADLEARIQRLTRAREALAAQRITAREEELKVLADAFARKLQAGGFSIQEGIAALRPYARSRLQDAPAAAPAMPSAPRGREPSKGASGEDLREHARRVLGGEASSWLRRPHPLLGGQTPQQMAATPQGLDKVHALLAAYARGA